MGAQLAKRYDVRVAATTIAGVPVRLVCPEGVTALGNGAVLGAELIAKLTGMRYPIPAALGFFSGSTDLAVAGNSESWMPLSTGGKSLAEAIRSYIGATEVKIICLTGTLMTSAEHCY